MRWPYIPKDDVGINTGTDTDHISNGEANVRLYLLGEGSAWYPDFEGCDHSVTVEAYGIRWIIDICKRTLLTGESTEDEPTYTTTYLARMWQVPPGANRLWTITFPCPLALDS